jgi:hypothetical protein
VDNIRRDGHRFGFWGFDYVVTGGDTMSVWYEITNQEDVEVSEDGKTIEVLFSTDNFGNNYVEIPIKFIEHCLHPAEGNANGLESITKSSGGKGLCREV